MADVVEKKKKKKKDKSGTGSGTKKKKSKRSESNSSLSPGPPRRITIVVMDSGKEIKRKVMMCPARWSDLLASCSELMNGSAQVVSLAPEMGGGEIDDIAVIAAGDILHVTGTFNSPSSGSDSAKSSSPRNGNVKLGNQRDSKKKSDEDEGSDASGPRTLSDPTSTPPTNTPPSSKSSTNASPSATPPVSLGADNPSWGALKRTGGSNSFGAGTSSAIARPSRRGQVCSFNKEIAQYTHYYKGIRGFFPFSRGFWACYNAALAEQHRQHGSNATPLLNVPYGSAYAMGVFCSDHEAVITEHVLKTTESDSGKIDKAFVRSVYRTKDIPETGLETLRFLGSGPYIDINCGHNSIAVIAVPNADALNEGKVAMLGSKHLHPVCLGVTTRAPDSGDGPFPVALPVNIEMAASCIKVAVGPLHSAAITVDNQLVTWGYNINCSLVGSKAEELRKRMQSGGAAPKYDVAGQLGHGRSDLFFCPPRVVKGISGDILDVSCGGAHTLCLSSTGVWAWGLNDEGQLGVTDNNLLPRQIKSLNARRIERICCGAHHSAALTSDGQLYTWGYNEQNQLGLTTTRRFVPEPTFVDALKAVRVRKVSCGNHHTVALTAEWSKKLTTKGDLYTWGANEYGQLGRKTKGKNVPAAVTLRKMYVIDVSCGPDSTLVLSAEGLLLACGKLMEKGFTSHSFKFRLIEQILENNIFVSSFNVGITHLAFISHISFSETLAMFIRACSLEPVPSEQLLTAVDKTPPFFLSKIQYRAMKVIARKDPKKPTITVKTGYVEMIHSSDNARPITITNTSKVSLVVEPSLQYTEFPKNCSFEFDPPQLKLGEGKSGVITMKMKGLAMEDSLTLLSMVATSKKESAQYIMVVVFYGPGSGPKADSNAVYAKERLASRSVPAPTPSTGQATIKPQDFMASIDFANADVVLYEKLGSGGSGAVVYRCTANGFTCAVKILDVEHEVKQVVDGFVHEIEMIEKLNHPRIVRYLGHDVNLTKVRLFMEFYPFSLTGILRKRRGQFFPTREVTKVALYLAEGLQYLHTQAPPIVHRDLKPGNVLCALDEQDNIKIVKITDFDVSRTLFENEQAITLAGTPQYCAPEVLSRTKEGYTVKADIYSFGMLLYELLTLLVPYCKEESRQVAALVERGQLPEIPEEVLRDQSRQGLLSVLYDCVRRDPRERPTALQLILRLGELQM